MMETYVERHVQAVVDVFVWEWVVSWPQVPVGNMKKEKLINEIG
jgi:hypothetical protein